MNTAGWNSSAAVRRAIQVALFYARKRRLERVEAQDAEDPPVEDDVPDSEKPA